MVMCTWPEGGNASPLDMRRASSTAATTALAAAAAETGLSAPKLLLSLTGVSGVSHRGSSPSPGGNGAQACVEGESPSGRLMCDGVGGYAGKCHSMFCTTTALLVRPSTDEVGDKEVGNCKGDGRPCVDLLAAAPPLLLANAATGGETGGGGGCAGGGADGEGVCCFVTVGCGFVPLSVFRGASRVGAPARCFNGDVDNAAPPGAAARDGAIPPARAGAGATLLGFGAGDVDDAAAGKDDDLCGDGDLRVEAANGDTCSLMAPTGAAPPARAACVLLPPPGGSELTTRRPVSQMIRVDDPMPAARGACKVLLLVATGPSLSPEGIGT